MTNPVTREAEGEHEHRWQNAGNQERERVSASPCSTWDDHIWTDTILLQTCECGATRRLLTGFKDRRRRGDDLRARDGNRPLGIPLQRSGVYKKPKVLR